MRIIFVFVLLIFAPHFGFSNSEVDQSDLAYENWESTVSRAESVLLAGRASEKSLEILRDEIGNWRSIFKTSIGINADRISLIQTQFDALPPAPDDGSEDPLKVRKNELKDITPFNYTGI